MFTLQTVALLCFAEHGAFMLLRNGGVGGWFPYGSPRARWLLTSSQKPTSATTPWKPFEVEPKMGQGFSSVQLSQVIGSLC